MPRVGRPARGKSLPKALPSGSVTALLAVLEDDPGPPGRSDWIERDRALILTSLLAGLRTEELLRATISDVRLTEDGAVMHVHGKGRKDRRIPVESVLVEAIQRYPNTRAAKFPRTTRRGSSPTGGLAAWPPAAPLFVGLDGQRLTRGALQYRVLRAFKRAGINGDRAKGALVHGLRHTFATELAEGKVSVYTLMNLPGHESISTSQGYVEAAGRETRAAAATNPLFALGGFVMRQVNTFKNRKIQFIKVLAENLYFRNLDNDVGAFHRLLGAAEVSEVKEAVLAYHFLRTAERPLAPEELDGRIESWCARSFGAQFDFEVAEGVSKLLDLSLATEIEDQRLAASSSQKRNDSSITSRTTCSATTIDSPDRLELPALFDNRRLSRQSLH